MQPYRSDLEALEARHAALESEVADRVRQRDEAARMLDEARRRQRDADLAADFAADVASGGPDRRRRRRLLVVVITGLVVVGAFIAMARVRAHKTERELFYTSVMTQFERFTDEACACKDPACVSALGERMSKWSADIASKMDRYPATPHLDEATLKRAQALGERMSKCMTDGMTAPTPQAERE